MTIAIRHGSTGFESQVASGSFGKKCGDDQPTSEGVFLLTPFSSPAPYVSNDSVSPGHKAPAANPLLFAV